MSHRLIVALMVGAALAPLGAEELLVRDLRLGVAMTPTAFSYTTSDALGSTSGDDELTDAYAASLRVSWSWSGAGRSWAPILGTELVAEQASYGTSGDYSQYALRGLAGFGWLPSEDWRLSALAMVGVGRPSFTVPVATGGTVSTAGASASTGLLIDVDYALNRRWSVGIETGWIEEAATLSGDGVDLDLTRSGLTVGLALTWGWSRQPVRLE